MTATSKRPRSMSGVARAGRAWCARPACWPDDARAHPTLSRAPASAGGDGEEVVELESLGVTGRAGAAARPRGGHRLAPRRRPPGRPRRAAPADRRLGRSRRRARWPARAAAARRWRRGTRPTSSAASVVPAARGAVSAAASRRSSRRAGPASAGSEGTPARARRSAPHDLVAAAPARLASMRPRMCSTSTAVWTEPERSPAGRPVAPSRRGRPRARRRACRLRRRAAAKREPAQARPAARLAMANSAKRPRSFGRGNQGSRSSLPYV